VNSWISPEAYLEIRIEGQIVHLEVISDLIAGKTSRGVRK